MQIDTRDIMKGGHKGEIVWVCDHRLLDINKKPIRHVKPTKVLVRSCDELPGHKRVCYSASYFSPLNKKGEPLAKIISPVDNTGYRSYSGETLNVFTTEAECIARYNELCDIVVQTIDKELSEVCDRLMEQKQKVIAGKR